MEIIKKRKSNCRSCGAEIIWVELKSGKSHPLDSIIVSSKGGDILYVDEITEFKKLEAGRKGYISHFATCPDAAKFRKVQENGK